MEHFVETEEANQSGKDIDTLNYDYEQLRVDTLPHFVGCSERKLDMRTAKLQQLFRCRKDNATYQIYFEQFVDMEELNNEDDEVAGSDIADKGIKILQGINK